MVTKESGASVAGRSILVFRVAIVSLLRRDV